jgi:hypothetical protein
MLVMPYAWESYEIFKNLLPYTRNKNTVAILVDIWNSQLFDSTCKLFMLAFSVSYNTATFGPNRKTFINYVILRQRTVQIIHL